MGLGIAGKGRVQRVKPRHTAQLHLSQFRSAQHKMQVALDKTRQQRPPTRLDQSG